MTSSVKWPRSSSRRAFASSSSKRGRSGACRRTSAACSGNLRPTTDRIASCRRSSAACPRRLSAAAASRPCRSFSNALGFRAHLSAPLRLDDVERALGLREAIDLADRIEAAAPGLMHLASRPETIGALVRAANASLDPAEVAQALVTHVTEWLPLTAWYVIAAEPDGVLQAPRQADSGGGAQERGRVVCRRHRADGAVGRARHQLRRRPRRRARAPGEVGRGLDPRLAARRQRQRRRRAGGPGSRPGAAPPAHAAGARRLARHASSSRRPTRWPTPCASREPKPCRSPTT